MGTPSWLQKSNKTGKKERLLPFQGRVEMIKLGGGGGDGKQSRSFADQLENLPRRNTLLYQIDFVGSGSALGHQAREDSPG